MPIEVTAVYEDGYLKPDHPLPYPEGARLVIVVKSSESWVDRTQGLIACPGEPGAMEYLMGPENDWLERPWANPSES